MHRTVDRIAVDVEDMSALLADHRPVAVMQIGDAVGEGRQRNGIRPQEHLPVAEANRERRAGAGSHDRRRIVAEDDGERIGAGHVAQHLVHGLTPAEALAAILGEQLSDDFRVGLRGENCAFGGQLFLDLGEILDDAVVDDSHTVDKMRMGVCLVRHAMGCPAGVGDADIAGQRLAGQLGLKIEELALRAPTIKLAVVDGGNTCGIIAAIFEPLQGVDETLRHGLVTDDADDAAHEVLRFIQSCGLFLAVPPQLAITRQVKLRFVS